MWSCEHCGCQAIAHDLRICPMCGKERDVPKITVAGGASSALGVEQGGEPELEAAQPAPAEPEPEVLDAVEGEGSPEPSSAAEALPEPSAEEPEPAAQPDDEEDGPADYSNYPKTVLTELCRDRGLPVTGTKAELANRLTDYDEAQVP
jgi:hypothetical protein